MTQRNYIPSLKQVIEYLELNGQKEMVETLKERCVPRSELNWYKNRYQALYRKVHGKRLNYHKTREGRAA